MTKSQFMKQYRESLLGRLCSNQRGQVLPWTGFMLISMLGMAALAIDFGRAYIAYHQLQSATDAAALAGAEQLPNSTASTYANNYSAGSGDLNTYAWMSGVSVTVTPKCLSSLSSIGMSCIAPANANALQVLESYNVPTYFARLFGINSIPVATKSTASMRGSTSIPYNVVIILDSTQSMNDTDSDSQCSTTRISCALSGIQTLLQDMAPCSSRLTACGSVTTGTLGAGNVSNPVDVVSLFTFPNVTTATVADDYNCSVPTVPGEYQFPVSTNTTYAPPGPAANYILGSGGTGDASYSSTYQVVGFSSDYRTSDYASGLNTSSNLVQSVGGESGCAGIIAKGGEGTFYAGVIYAAQAALDAEKAARGTATQNVIILISDGDATSSNTQMGNTTGGATSGGTYPSWNNECAQAVTAATFAASKGTRIYSVAYGAEATGCSTDSPSTTPCQTMEGIASSSGYFYSDYTAKGGSSSCVSSSQPTTNLNQIFTDIANDFTAARLVPNGTT
jgi:Flp pilus assembly protein TadG